MAKWQVTDEQPDKVFVRARALNGDVLELEITPRIVADYERSRHFSRIGEEPNLGGLKGDLVQMNEISIYCREHFLEHCPEEFDRLTNTLVGIVQDGGPAFRDDQPQCGNEEE